MTGVRRTSNRRISRRGIALVVICVVLLVVTASVEASRLHRMNEKYARIEQELEQKISREEERRAELEKLRDYTETEDYAEWYAKQYLGMVRENEILIRGE